MNDRRVVETGIIVRGAAPPAEPSPWWWDGAVYAYVLSALAFVFSRSGTDPDLWGHLRFGRDFWLTWSVNRPDPYSFVSAGREWFNHEWLAEALSWTAWAWWGSAGLVALKTAIGLTIAVLMLRHLRRRGVVVPLAAILVALGCVILALGLYNIRPQAFTYLCFALELLILERADRGHTRWSWVLVPLFALWANLHGGFLAGLGILGVFALGSLAEALVSTGEGRLVERVLRRPLVWVAAASALATWLNPYGPRLWVFLRTAFAARGEIAEWNPIQVGSAPGIIFLGLAIATWVSVALTPRKVSPARLVALFVTTVAPLMAIRHAPLFALAFMVLAAEHLAATVHGVEEVAAGQASAASADRGVGRRLVVAAMLAQAVGILVFLPGNFSCIAVEEGMPARAVALLRASGVRGNLALVFDWGEYAIWHLSPAIKVGIDGRRETLYEDDVYWRDYRFTFALGDDWDRLLGEGPVDLVLTSRHFPVFSAMKRRADWELVYEDETSGLFARRDSVPAERLRLTPVPIWANAPCFP